MNVTEISEIIAEYIVDALEIGDDPDFATDINLFDYGYLDSMGAASLLLWLEERFHIVISQRDIVRNPMNSVDEIAAVVAEKLGA